MKDSELYEHITCNDKDTKKMPFFDTYFFHINIIKKVIVLETSLKSNKSTNNVLLI